MSQNDHLLRKLCTGETLARARELLQIAKTKTGPGSGHDLGSNSSGLPGICAFLASEELRNYDVSKQAAQSNACMTPAVFDKSYRTVRSALGISERRGRSGAKKTYDDLCNSYAFSKSYGSALLGWLRKAENTLNMSDKKINMESAHVKYAIFFWVYNTIESKTLDMASYAEENQAKLDKIQFLCKILDSSGSLRLTIAQESKKASSPAKLAATPFTSPRKSPSKRPLRELPSKDSPKKRKISPEPQADPAATETISNDVEMASLEEDPLALPVNHIPAPFTTPRNSPTKRPQKQLRELPSRDAKKTKVVSEPDPRGDSTNEDELLPQTPSKAHKSSSPLKAATALNPHASSSRLALDALRARRPESSSPTRRSKAVSDTPHKSVRNDPTPASPSKRSQADAMEVIMQNDASSSEDESSAPEVRRRFRPVFLDRQQWFKRDHRLESMLKEAEKFKRRRERFTKDRPQVDVTMDYED